MLPETEQKRIREEAERIFPKGDYQWQLSRAIHTNAATLYQERINGLLEALEKINGKDLWKKHSPYSECVSIARTALDTYNKTINNG